MDIAYIYTWRRVGDNSQYWLSDIPPGELPVRCTLLVTDHFIRVGAGLGFFGEKKCSKFWRKKFFLLIHFTNINNDPIFSSSLYTSDFQLNILIWVAAEICKKICDCAKKKLLSDIKFQSTPFSIELVVSCMICESFAKRRCLLMLSVKISIWQIIASVSFLFKIPDPFSVGTSAILCKSQAVGESW